MPVVAFSLAINILVPMPELVNISVPTTNVFQVSSSKFQVEAVKIYNVLGERVWASPPHWGGREGLINISSLQKGIYFVEVKTEIGEVRKKVIKE